MQFYQRFPPANLRKVELKLVDVFSIAALTMVLSLAVYQIIVSDKLPSSSTAVPIIGQSISVEINHIIEIYSHQLEAYRI